MDFGGPIIKFYVVVLRDTAGSITNFKVTAYDAMEACLAALSQAKARGTVDPEIIDFYPDEKALSKHKNKTFVDSVTKLIERQSKKEKK